MNRRHLIALSPAVLLACAQPQLMRPAAGVATAELNDSLDDNADRTGVRVFAVWSIDGVEVPNAIRTTMRMGFGAGAANIPYFVARPIEAKRVVVEIVGQHVVGAPIEQIARMAKGTFQRARGKLVFQPTAGLVYQVRGKLSPDMCELWIEEFESKNPVTEVLRVKSEA